MERRAFVDAGEIIKIGRLLDEHLRLQDTGFWDWDEGWSPNRVAAEVGGHCNVNHVNRVRLKLKRPVGTAPMTRKPNDEDHSDEPVLDRLMALEARFQAIWDWARRVGFKPPTVPPPLGEG